LKRFGLVFFTLFLSTPAWATWPAAPIATVIGQSTDSFNASAVTGAMNSTGAKVFVAAMSRQWDCNTPGIQDSMGNTWLLLASSNAAGMGPTVDIWWAKADHTGPGHTFQPNVSGCFGSGAPSYASIAVMAWNNSENLTGSIVDQLVRGDGSTASPITAGAILPTTTNQMVISAAAGGITSSSWGGVSAGFTAAAQIPQGPNAYTLAVGYQIQTTATSVNPAWTWGGTGIMVAMNVSLFNHIDLGCSGSSPVWTTTPDQPSVQKCVTSASSGDTINISAGTPVEYVVPVTWSGKKLTIIGAGVGNTVLTGLGNIFVVNGISATNFLDISNITFQTDPSTSIFVSGNGLLYLRGSTVGTFEQGFNFHNNKIDVICCNPPQVSTRGLVPEGIYGIIHHNTLNTECSCQIISPTGASGADGGFTAWQLPLTLGTTNAVYLENNIWNGAVDGESVIDAYTGARMVIRGNQFNNSSVGFHGLDSGGFRSPVSWEIYGNVFTNNIPSSQFRSMTIRGGTGIEWGNTFTGTQAWYGSTIVLYRAWAGYAPNQWGFCDGTQWDLRTDTAPNPSCTLGFLQAGPANGIGACGVPAGTGARFSSVTPDDLCRGAISGTCTRFLDANGSHGYPCRDQPGFKPNQILSPMYEWNNGNGGGFGVFDGGGGLPPNNVGIPLENWMAENREYYIYTGTPNHTGCNTVGNCAFTGIASSSHGVGIGKRADRPTTCTAGVAYWSVDQGSWNTTNDVAFKYTLDSVDYFSGVLDVCSATNTWTNASYMPYTFPHPLDVVVPPPAVTMTVGGRLRRR